MARTKANVHVPGVRTPAARPHVSSRRTQVSCAYRLPTSGTTGRTQSWRIQCSSPKLDGDDLSVQTVLPLLVASHTSRASRTS